MTTPSDRDGAGGAAADSPGDAPFLPPARPTLTQPDLPAPTLPSATSAPVPSTPAPSAPASTATPFLPSAASAAPPAAPAPAADPTFDAKAMVESQKHVNTDPAYGAMPAGTDESRAAARKLRENANRKRRRRRGMTRVVGLLVLAGLVVGGFFAYQAITDDDESVPESGAEADGDGGALTPLGEQEQVIEVIDDLAGGATPSAGGLLDAVDDAREVVGQAEPPAAAPGSLLVADVFTPAVLDHTDMLDPVDGFERFVIRAVELGAVNPSANDALLGLLAGLPQVAADDPQLSVAPVVLPGDVGVAIQRDGDRITRVVAVAADPPIAAVGP